MDLEERNRRLLADLQEGLSKCKEKGDKVKLYERLSKKYEMKENRVRTFLRDMRHAGKIKEQGEGKKYPLIRQTFYIDPEQLKAIRRIVHRDKLEAIDRGDLLLNEKATVSGIVREAISQYLKSKK